MQQKYMVCFKTSVSVKKKQRSCRRLPSVTDKCLDSNENDAFYP